MFIVRFLQRIKVLYYYIESLSDFSYNLASRIIFFSFIIFVIFAWLSDRKIFKKRKKMLCGFAFTFLAVSLFQFFFSFFTMFLLGEGWGDWKFLHVQTSSGTRAVTRTILHLQYEGLSFPEDYVYDGYFSREYLSEILEDYSDLDEANVMKTYFTQKNFSHFGTVYMEMFYSDALKPGKYYWQHFTRDHEWGYTGSAFRIYINVPDGIICVWGVGPNLKYDLNREKIDKLFKEDKLASVGVQNSLQWTLDTPNNEFPHFLIKRIGFEGKRYWSQYRNE